MTKEYIADKQTLDSVNSKIGTSSDTESGTPSTLFAGVKNIIKGITELKKSVSDGKTKVANAITGKGISTATNVTFDTMANNINAITTLNQGTNDANATAAQILSGRTAYVKGSKITGTIPSKGAATITPSTANQTIGAGQYLSGAQTIAGSTNLAPGNIKQGVNLFGVVGNVKSFSDVFKLTYNQVGYTQQNVTSVSSSGSGSYNYGYAASIEKGQTITCTASSEWEIAIIQMVNIVCRYQPGSFNTTFGYLEYVCFPKGGMYQLQSPDTIGFNDNSNWTPIDAVISAKDFHTDTSITYDKIISKYTFKTFNGGLFGNSAHYLSSVLSSTSNSLTISTANRSLAGDSIRFASKYSYGYDTNVYIRLYA